jgi:hypothetical protein
MPPTPPASQPPPQGPPSGRGITMMGANRTGKTTFLAALQIALLRRPELGWTLTGEGEASTQALVSFTDRMTHDHLFPVATAPQLENYRWSLDAELPGAIKEWHWWGFRRRSQYVKIPLNLVDAPGSASDGSQVFTQSLTDRLVSNLTGSGGIVLFFDPMREFEYGDAFRHTYGVLTALKAQAGRRGRLPHHVAVCITKFDEIKVLRSAEMLKVVQYDPEKEEFPRVSEEYAQEFFQRLVRLSRSDNANLILPLLQETFHEDRIKFFVTSAIGFYVDPWDPVFDPEDYQNHIPGQQNGDQNRIRGGIYPINVLEPILWLGRNMPRTAG